MARILLGSGDLCHLYPEDCKQRNNLLKEEFKKITLLKSRLSNWINFTETEQLETLTAILNSYLIRHVYLSPADMILHTVVKMEPKHLFPDIPEFDSYQIDISMENGNPHLCVFSLRSLSSTFNHFREDAITIPFEQIENLSLEKTPPGKDVNEALDFILFVHTKQLQ